MHRAISIIIKASLLRTHAPYYNPGLGQAPVSLLVQPKTQLTSSSCLRPRGLSGPRRSTRTRSQAAHPGRTFCYYAHVYACAEPSTALSVQPSEGRMLPLCPTALGMSSFAAKVAQVLHLVAVVPSPPPSHTVSGALLPTVQPAKRRGTTSRSLHGLDNPPLSHSLTHTACATSGRASRVGEV